MKNIEKCVILLFIPFFQNISGFVVFQESFQDTSPRFETFETKHAKIEEISGSRAISIDLAKSGYFRFNIPFARARLLEFSFRPGPWRQEAVQDSDYAVQFLHVHSYNTKKVPYEQALFLILLLRQDKATGALALAALNGRNDTLFARPVQQEVFNLFKMEYEIDASGRCKGSMTLNSGPAGAVSIPYPTGDMTLFTVGSMGTTGSAQGERTFALDNIVLSDAAEEISFAIPAFTASTHDTSLIRLDLKPLAHDSLVEILIAPDTAPNEPLLYRSVPAGQSEPFITGFPFRPGQYLAKIRSVKKNGLLTDYSPAAKIDIAGSRVRDTVAVASVNITEEATGRRADALARGVWYILEPKLSQISECFAVFWLHHPDYVYGGPHNKGGYFDRTRNYIFNLSFGGEIWLYASREDVKGRSVRVDGQEYVYIDDRDTLFKQDTVNRTAKVRFKLLPEAEPGPWLLSGYIEKERDNRSFMFVKPIPVLSEKDIAARAAQAQKRRRLILLAVLAVLLFAAGLYLGVRAYLGRKPAPGFTQVYETVKSGGVYLKNTASKHRHVVARVQRFIFDNIAKEISLSDAAAHLNLSGPWVAQVFKEATGHTVVRFINAIKVERAKELLRTDQSVTDIAMLVGFASHEHFRRVFKEYTGVTPTAFRTSLSKRGV
jgi:AraC-like DNA-binding protein